MTFWYKGKLQSETNMKCSCRLSYAIFPDWTMRKAQMRKIIHLKIDGISGDGCSKNSCIKNAPVRHQVVMQEDIWSRAWGYSLSIFKGLGRSWNRPVVNKHLWFPLKFFLKSIKILAHTIPDTKGITFLLHIRHRSSTYHKKKNPQIISFYMFSWYLENTSCVPCIYIF